MIFQFDGESDPDFDVIAGVSNHLGRDYLASDAWAGSPFEWIVSAPPATKGSAGEAMVSDWARSRGFSVSPRSGWECDRIINGHRIEVKMSTLWRSGIVKFQQIRDQDYDFCFCLGLMPFGVRAWLLPKEVLLEHVIGVMGQHTGARGKDTAWLGFSAHAPYEWMAPYGDRLADVAQRLAGSGPGVY